MRDSKTVNEKNIEDLAMFLNSIFWRQPEVISAMRHRMENGLRKLDRDAELTRLMAGSLEGIRPRDLAIIDGRLASDAAIQNWLDGMNDPKVLDEMIFSKFCLIQTPKHSPIPLSDRPYVILTKEGERLRMFPVTPNKLLVLRKTIDPTKDTFSPSSEGLYKLYLKHALGNAKRGVVVSCSKAAWLALEWFQPQELQYRDFGPGTDNKYGDLYRYGEQYALTQ